MMHQPIPPIFLQSAARVIKLPDAAFKHPHSNIEVRAVLFDLDGTLVDSAPDITHAVNTVLVQDGALPLSVDTVRTLIGEGIHRLVEKAYALRQRTFNLHDLNQRTAMFAGEYEAHIADLTRPYPGVLAGLSVLRRTGIKISVVSNKAQHLTDHLMQTLELVQHFDLVLGARENLPKKPAPDMLYFAMEELHVTANETIFVGDSIADVRAAAAAHLPCILIEGGYTTEPTAQLGAWKTVSDFNTLVGLLVHSA
jgi:phosphoglycolate phosphatase